MAVEKISVVWLMANAQFNDLGAYGTVSRMWEEKFDEMSDAFIASVDEVGVKAPIIYVPGEKTVYNGHHRVLVAWLKGAAFISYVSEFNECSEEFSVKQGLPESRKESIYG